jgi:hypothetical protein
VGVITLCAYERFLIRVYTIKIPYTSCLLLRALHPAIQFYPSLTYLYVPVVYRVFTCVAHHCIFAPVTVSRFRPIIPDIYMCFTLYSAIQQASLNHTPPAPALEFPFRADTSQSGASGGFSLFGFGRSPGKSAQARGEEVPTSCVVDADTLRSVSGAGNGSHKTSSAGELRFLCGVMAVREIVCLGCPRWLRFLTVHRTGRCCCSLCNCVVCVLTGGNEGTGCAYSFQVRVQGSQGTEVTVTYVSSQHKVPPLCALIYLAFQLCACVSERCFTVRTCWGQVRNSTSVPFDQFRTRWVPNKASPYDSACVRYRRWTAWPRRVAKSSACPAARWLPHSRCKQTSISSTPHPSLVRKVPHLLRRVAPAATMDPIKVQAQRATAMSCRSGGVS